MDVGNRETCLRTYFTVEPNLAKQSHMSNVVSFEARSSVQPEGQTKVRQFHDQLMNCSDLDSSIFPASYTGCASCRARFRTGSCSSSGSIDARLFSTELLGEVGRGRRGRSVGDDGGAGSSSIENGSIGLGSGPD